jgi:hypothetical protein
VKGKFAVVLLFWIAALYDGVLGIVFLVSPSLPFERFGVTPPNHMGYVQFPAALLIVFALMFAAVALRPVANRNFILVGIGLKISYCSIVFWYWLGQGIPWMWKPFAIADLAFLVLFVWAWLWLRKQAKV